MVRSAREVSDARAGVTTTPEVNPITDVVGPAPVIVARRNAMRVGLTIINTDPSHKLAVSPDDGVTLARGIVLLPNGSLSVDESLDYTLPTQEWWAVGEAEGQSVYVLETNIAPTDVLNPPT
jgi:hypothetical protein